MSDSGFEDDDDDLLLQLVEATQKPPTSIIPNEPSHPNFQSQLFRAQGEISILRAQLESLQNARSEEISKLSAEAKAIQASAQEHVTALKQTVDKLEDEKKFLGNEIRSLSSVKRRKVNENGMSQAVTVTTDRDTGGLLKSGNGSLQSPPHDNLRGSDQDDSIPKAHLITQHSRIQLEDDWSQFCHHLWHYTINGSDRTSMEFLSKICTESTLDNTINITIPANIPFSVCIWNTLLNHKYLRLDMFVNQICKSILSVINELLRLHEHKEPGVLVSVPFLISIVHASINFKSSAISESLVKELVGGFCKISQKFAFVLYLNDEEDEAFSGHNTVPHQQRLMENFILVSAFDVLESAAVICTQFGEGFSQELWNSGILDINLMQQILPENTERFVASVQINLVSNFVEILSASISEDQFCSSNVALNRSIVKSLLKVFIIDIRIKEDFMFYGLNRVLGNNTDFHKISQAVPSEPERFFNKSLISMPYPIKLNEQSAKEKFHVAFQHDCHLLTLRVRIVMLLESIVVSGKMELLNSKENIKSIVRIIGYEQNHLLHQPRYELIHMRITIIGVFVRILFYIIEGQKNINTLIYPETLYEIFVVLMKIAFASDSLSFEAHELMSEIRARGITDIGIFNKSCEFRSREMAHFDLYDSNPKKYADLAGIEGEFANGLEFPYESDTVEIAREILSVCVNHDEADNLYYNMNRETQ
ncbi:hypothetical protein JCM33374_g5354 [Metschnikowia sp. JCM 33374]|nr:hypothetical protein JCM33374_g5354 [Metschnikowia sp. JCM 33374]